jgi:lipopolysaccharide/colanic/teichoic acid biosynthesis glycosyltransferase
VNFPPKWAHIRTNRNRSYEPAPIVTPQDHNQGFEQSVSQMARTDTQPIQHAGASPSMLPELEYQQSVPVWRRALPTSSFRTHLSNALIRTLDIVVSLALLILLSPVILIAAIVIRLDSPGPAFFRVGRVGFRSAPLEMLKFRKMQDGASGPSLTMDDDHRFTRIGATLAKLKIDEIPQLWNVLMGEMSLVGPRPEDEQFVEMHEVLYRTILSVRPGITGLSQIAFAEESRILDDEDPIDHYVGRILPQKVLLDVIYAENRSLRLNLRILFWTTGAVILRRQVAVHRESGKMNLRRRKKSSQ